MLLMAHLVLVLSQVAVGSAAVLARWGLAAHLTPRDMTMWRLVLASAAVLGLAHVRRARGDRRALSWPERTRLVIAGVAMAGHFWAWFASLEHVSVARSTLLVSTTPVWAVLGTWVYRRVPPSKQFWAGLTVALGGSWLVSGGPSAAMSVRTGGSGPIGDALAVGGAALIAAYFMLTSDLQVSLGTGRVVCWTYTAAALTMLTWSFATEGRIPVPSSTGAWGAVVGMALVPQLLGHTMLNWSLVHFTPAVVGTATLLEPVVAGVLAWWFFAEPVGSVQAVGAMLLLSGVWLVLQDRQPRASVGAPPVRAQDSSSR